jgi:three-Cys-motif partner protein
MPTLSQRSEQWLSISSNASGPPPTFLDQLGEWSEIKHQILDGYAQAYTTILTRQRAIRRIVYIDAFAGSGVALDRATDELPAGSPFRALRVNPPFDELHFVEQDPQKVDELQHWVGNDSRVTIHEGDANQVLISDVLPRCRYEDFARGLCFLDPYGLSVEWNLLTTIAQCEAWRSSSISWLLARIAMCCGAIRHGSRRNDVN